MSVQKCAHGKGPEPTHGVLKVAVLDVSPARLTDLQAAAVVGGLASVSPEQYARQQAATGEKAGVRSVAAFLEELAARMPKCARGIGRWGLLC